MTSIVRRANTFRPEFEHLFIDAVEFHELLVGSFLDEASVLEYEYAIDHQRNKQTVRYY